jgi:hypothetical protein
MSLIKLFFAGNTSAIGEIFPDQERKIAIIPGKKGLTVTSRIPTD